MHLLELDLAIYSLTAIKKAVYRFGARCDATIEMVSTDRARITFRPHAGEGPERLLADFRREVLDQDLRELIGRETEAVRNLILAQAFSKTALLDATGDSAAFGDDPLRINNS
jgi:His-Xaa-Ser system protein HxsD